MQTKTTRDIEQKMLKDVRMPIENHIAFLMGLMREQEVKPIRDFRIYLDGTLNVLDLDLDLKSHDRLRFSRDLMRKINI